MPSSAYERGVRDRMLLEEQRQRAVLSNQENIRKEQEAKDLAKQRDSERKAAQLKLDDETSRRAADFQRQQIIQSQVARGTNYVDAIRNGLQAVPLQTVKDTTEVLSTLDKLAKPPERFGAATMQAGDQTLYGQTNNEGRFYPVSVPKPPAEKGIKLQTSDEGTPQYVTVPVTSSTNVLNSLPPDLQTNQFNKASMASIVPRPSSTLTSNSPAPVDPSAPSLSPAFALQSAQNPPPQSATPVSAPTVQEVSRVTPDGRIAIFDANSKQFLRYDDTSTTNDGSQ